MDSPHQHQVLRVLPIQDPEIYKEFWKKNFNHEVNPWYLVTRDAKPEG